MNDFIVTIDEEKFIIKTSDSKKVKLGDRVSGGISVIA